MSEDKIIARIARALAEGDAVEGLTRSLPATDLQSLMLHVYRERGARRTPAELLEQYERRAMVQAKSIDVRLLLEVERVAFEQAAAFEAIDLSPVAPLGINAGLCLSVDAFTREGLRRNLADGGFTTWTQRLLSNAKERLLVSGMGIELLVKLFR
jgi:hypothetical protein